MRSMRKENAASGGPGCGQGPGEKKLDQKLYKKGEKNRFCDFRSQKILIL